MKELAKHVAFALVAFVIGYFAAPFLIDSYLDFDKVGNVICTEKGCYSE
jgi:hypothetical protein